MSEKQIVEYKNIKIKKFIVNRIIIIIKNIE